MFAKKVKTLTPTSSLNVVPSFRSVEVKPTMSDVNPFKETFLLGSLNVALPTVDVYSDLALTTVFYNNNHPNWASLVLGPFLVNYTLCWISWFTTEKQKKFTWIAALLGCYPQLVAARIIWLFWTQPKKGVREKKHLERNLMENEIFTEAVPSTLIMTFVMFVAIRIKGGRDLVLGADPLLFFVTFFTSVLSAGLGLAKILKVGASQTSLMISCDYGDSWQDNHDNDNDDLMEMTAT